MLTWKHVATVSFVLLGLCLALPGRAQMMSLQQLARLTAGVEKDKPVPVVVLNTVNHSAISFDGMEHAFTDKLAEELTNTKAFAPVDRTTAEALVKELGMIPPYSIASQVLLAKELQCAYVITSTIDSAKIVQSREGTYAEVLVTALVMSKVLQEQQISTQMIMRSKPQVRQPATDAMMREALNYDAYRIAQKLLAFRIPSATVISISRSDEIVLRGGSLLGIRKDMIFIATRRGQPTGKVRVFLVNSAESYACELESSHISPGDIAFPVYYEEQPVYGRPQAPLRTGFLVFLAVGALFVLAGSR